MISKIFPSERKKITQLSDDSGIDPAFDFLTATSGADQTGLVQFLDVVGDGRGNDIELAAQVTDTGGFASVNDADRSGFAATGQALKYLQAVGVGQRLENLGEAIDLYAFIIRHISKYKTIDAIVKGAIGAVCKTSRGRHRCLLV